MSVSPVPAGYHSVTPYLLVKHADQAIAFYARAFGAVEQLRLSGPEGRVAHAEVKIGNSIVMLADEMPEQNYLGPQPGTHSPAGLCIYVTNADEVVERAVAAGAQLIRPVQNQFYGDRSGGVTDPFGHSWTIATHIEDLSPEEIQQRYEAL